jgi:hypothetical protein
MVKVHESVVERRRFGLDAAEAVPGETPQLEASGLV